MAKTLTEIFNETAAAIQEKTGKSEPIPAENFGSEIESIETGGGTTKYLEFPANGCLITLKSDILLNKLIELNVDVDAEMEMTGYYYTEGGIYIGSGTVSLINSSEADSIMPVYLAIYGYEGSGNIQIGFAFNAGDWGTLGFNSSEAGLVHNPFTIKDMINTFNGEISLGVDSTVFDSLKGVILYPRIGVKTGSAASEITWYDVTMEDMLSFLEVIPAD